jgi:phenylalanyl-tRNA synthetase beta chain
MLCSARELGLGENHEGLLELPDDAPLGQPLERYLALDDTVLELGITPNRGDCLSQLGVAREAAVLSGLRFAEPAVAPVPAASARTFPVAIAAPADCPVYAGRLISGIRADARSPAWLTERLRRAGLRAIHPVVDVTNYVMLELGQPMHGFDAATLDRGIVVRRATPGEALTLLDGKRVALDPEVLVIADQGRVRAIAGVMGGVDSGVTRATTDVFLESAWFAPQAIAGRARRFGLHTDAAQRFERGVDPTGQVRAIERATALLLAIAGGTPGPVVEQRHAEHLPKRRPVALRRAKLAAVLGIPVADAEVQRILTGLGLAVTATAEGWQATAPAWRFDIEREEDLVEEVGRVNGYDKVPAAQSPARVAPLPSPEGRPTVQRLRQVLVDRGFDEAITYSFVDPVMQERVLGPGVRPRLVNPIAADMAELRASLLTGLLTATNYNLARQQDRVRLFEYGVRFISQGTEYSEENVLSALAIGPALPAQWGERARPVDFADLKADLEAVLAVAAGTEALRYEPLTDHPALHPGRAARVLWQGTPIGVLGEIHPRVVKALDLPSAPVFFEVSVGPLQRALPKAHLPSKFPRVRRDLAVVVAEAVTAEALLETVRRSAGEHLAEVAIFDVYRGKGIDSGQKSVAMTLILQDSSCTLTDDDTDSLMQRVAQALGTGLGAVLRD